MKYLKLFESFTSEYRSKFDQLENQYKEKIDKSIISILEKLYDYIKKEGVDEIIIEPKLNGNGEVIGNLTAILTNHDWMELGNNGMCSIVSKRSDSNAFSFIFEKHKDGYWVVLYDDEIYREDDSPVNIVDGVKTYRKTQYIDNLLKNFSRILNKDIFLQLNK